MTKQSFKYNLNTYNVYLSPEGRVIATVHALSERDAIRKAPKPYRKFLGEMYAVKVERNPEN